jgi:hypothetical protein
MRGWCGFHGFGSEENKKTPPQERAEAWPTEEMAKEMVFLFQGQDLAQQIPKQSAYHFCPNDYPPSLTVG